MHRICCSHLPVIEPVDAIAPDRARCCTFDLVALYCLSLILGWPISTDGFEQIGIIGATHGRV